MRALVGRAGGDVDRDVADQPDAAVGGVRPQRGPLALEAHLVGDRAAAGDRRPALDPAGLALAEVELLALLTGAAGSASRPGQAAKAERALYGEP